MHQEFEKTGQDIKIEINSKFKDAVSNVKKGCFGDLWIRVLGLVEISENISLLEHVTGLKSGKNIFIFFYYPLSKDTTNSFIGSYNGKENESLTKLLSNDKKLSFLTLTSSE